MNIQWYPGHMTKAKRQMQEDIKLVDMVIELLDARIPASSKNPDIDDLAQNKARLVILNKADLADENANRKWQAYFEKKGIAVILADARSAGSFKTLSSRVNEACREKIERDRRRVIKNRPILTIVAGIPYVGKSTFINSYAKKAVAKTGNRPGVTKGKQWIRLGKDLELLDTPGILWPKFEDEKVGVNLSLTGSISDNILNLEELSLKLIAFLRENYAGILNSRFGAAEEGTDAELLYAIGERRGCVGKGGEISYEKAANILIDEFRSGKLGRISLELPPEE